MIFAGINKKKAASTSSDSSWLSSHYFASVLDKLKSNQTREFTKGNYQAIWRKFNSFFIKLVERPKDWEDRVLLYCRHLIDQGIQLSTVKSYISALRFCLRLVGYNLTLDELELRAIIRGCKMTNDQLRIHLPIKWGLFHLILTEVERKFNGAYGQNPQPYLETMYLCIFSLAYYGMMHVGEMVFSKHAVCAHCVQIGQNKKKILLVLYS